MKKDIFQVVAGTAVLCALMDIVFLFIGKFDLPVFYGTVLGFLCACANFIFLAFTISVSLNKGKASSGYMGISYLLRLFLIAVVVVYSIKSPYTNYVATVIPLIFPRVIITLIQGIMKSKNKTSENGGDNLGRT